MNFSKKFEKNSLLDEEDLDLLKEIDKVMELKDTGIMMDDDDFAANKLKGSMNFDEYANQYDAGFEPEENP